MCVVWISLVNVNTTVLVPTEESVAGGITLPDREFSTKEFPHSSCRFIAKFISQVLVNSRAQQTLSAKQTTSIIKIKVNKSSEAQFFEVISGGFFIEKDLSQGTLPCQIPPPLGEIDNFAPPILESHDMRITVI